MGYTHYWTIPAAAIRPPVWTLICDDIRKLVIACSVELYAEYDQPSTKPLIDKENVIFNGAGDEGHETFYLSRGSHHDFNFCKTANKPYDTIVVACLLVLAKHVPTAQITSDGSGSDWKAGHDFAKQVLGEGYDIPATITER